MPPWMNWSKTVRGVVRQTVCGILLAAVCLPFFAPVARGRERFGAFLSGDRVSDKVICLTFDDGPHPRYTERILSVLAEYGVVATFFFVGENVALYGDVAKKVAALGHEIGNHTQTHPHMQKIGDDALIEEISKAQREITAATGAVPTLFRPPEGKITKERSALLGKMGFRGVLWSVDTLDWKGTSAEVIANGILEKIKGGDVILCHDYVGHPTTTVDALRLFLPELIKKGYRFVTVSQLIEEECSVP